MLVVKCWFLRSIDQYTRARETRDMFKMSFVTISAFLTMNTQMLSWNFMSSIELKHCMRYLRWDRVEGNRSNYAKLLDLYAKKKLWSLETYYFSRDLDFCSRDLFNLADYKIAEKNYRDIDSEGSIRSGVALYQAVHIQCRGCLICCSTQISSLPVIHIVLRHS